MPGVGNSKGGARIWVSLGPINFQPGEFAKIALALFFAGYLADHRELIAAGAWRVGPFHLPELRHLLPIALAWGFAVVVMVAEKDLGSSLLFFTLFVVMMWVSTERASYLVIGLLLFAGAAYVAWRLFDHVQTRVAIWRDPWPQYEGKGYQIVQAMFAFANGGTGGTGLGLGSPNKIPVAKTDFIFAAIGEEMGLLGATAILIGFLLIIGGGLRIAIRAERPFEKLLATGLTTIVGMQAFIIIGGVIRVVPLTGITLPFVSYGGSSLLANYVLLALLVRVSDSTARRLGEMPERTDAAGTVRGLPAAASGSEGGADEQADPPPRRRPAGVLPGVVRAAERAGGRPPASSSTPTRATTARPSATSTGRAARSSPPTARCWRAACRPCRATSSSTSASTRPAICSATSPATTRTASARRSSSGRRTTC